MFCLNNHSFKLTLYLTKQKLTEFQEVLERKIQSGRVRNMSIFYNIFTVWIFWKDQRKLHKIHINHLQRLPSIA